MIDTPTLMNVLRGFVLEPGERVDRVKEFPDGPALFVETAARSLVVRAVGDRLHIGRMPWVAGVVEVTREDVDTGGPQPRRVLVLPVGEDPIDLGDPRDVAELGRSLREGSLDPLAYAEVLVEFHWPAPGRRLVVTDPERWRAELPAGTPEPPPVQAPRVWDDEEGDRWLSFSGVRYDPDGGPPEVTLWSVDVPPVGPATWLRRPARKAAG